MLTQTQIAVAVGLELRQTQNYLSIAVNEVRRKKLLAPDEVLVQTIGRKDYYHPIVIEEIKQAINYVQRTRYERSIRTRRESERLRQSRKDNNYQKSAQVA